MFGKIKLILVLTIMLIHPYESEQNLSQEKRISAFINGDFIIGALFPLHDQPDETNRGIKCGKIRESYGIQRVEVTFHTLDVINKNPNLLPNLTLGVEIRDECWYAPVALQQSIEFIRDAITPTTNIDTCANTDSRKLSKQIKGPLIGVVGPGSSSVAIQVQNLLQLFHLPQVGYSTTSRRLSDKERFNYFLRVVPSDFYQAQLILDIVRYHGWTYVSVVNTEESYGESGIQAFRELAAKVNVCIAREDAVLSTAANATFDKIIKNLRQDSHARVVVCFCEGKTVRGLLAATKRLNMSSHFLIIGSDGWADRVEITQNYEKEAWGSLSIRIHSPTVEEFDNYYFDLNPISNTRNPWFKEFWENYFSCSFTSFVETTSAMSLNISDSNSFPQRLCTGSEKRSRKSYRQDSKLRFVIKAIYTLAHALHNMQQGICGKGWSGVCDKLFPFNGTLFKDYLMNVSFQYEKDTIEFDKYGDPPGRYDIMNFQLLENGTYDYVHVGNWSNGNLTFFSHHPLQFGFNRTVVKSVCSEPCPHGHYKNVQQGGKEKRCCWVCVRCLEGEVLYNSDTENCTKCPNGFIPNRLQTVCVRLPIEFMQWFDTQAVVAMMFSTFGFTTTSFAFGIFLKYNNTPVVKSSTKELSYIILIGMFVSHASVFAILAKPNYVTCALSRLLPGISFAMIYAALLTKTNRIARILAGSKKRIPTRKPKFMSATAQVVITFFLIGIEVFISASMLFYQEPEESYNYQTRRTILECNTTPEAIVVPLAFDFFLIILCTLYALKTRNVPENFNEAKFIGFAMYTTCVIWIAFVPIYFGSDSKVITLCMCVTLSALVTWLFLFVPKLYIIIFQPEKNNRALFTTSKSIRCHIGSRVASAVTEKSSTNSWHENSVSGKELEKTIKETPQKRTLSCQTGTELLQYLLLNPKALVDACSPVHSFVPRITERDCCEADNCQVKKITIKIPDRQHCL